jgi:hypothetical protein
MQATQGTLAAGGGISEPWLGWSRPEAKKLKFSGVLPIPLMRRHVFGNGRWREQPCFIGLVFDRMVRRVKDRHE